MLRIKPISLREANKYIEQNHRHHSRVQGCKFALSVYDDETIHGVVVVGRPLSRYLDDGSTLEVTRLCTDGTYNACSILYSRSAKIAKEMGYDRIITYILEDETGTSLKASGWKLDESNIGGGDWQNCTRRIDERSYVQMSLFEQKPKYPTGKKQRWVKNFYEGGVRYVRPDKQKRFTRSFVA